MSTCKRKRANPSGDGLENGEPYEISFMLPACSWIDRPRLLGACSSYHTPRALSDPLTYEAPAGRPPAAVGHGRRR